MNGLAWDRTQAVNGSPSPLVPFPMLWLLPIVAATALHAPAQPPDGSKLVKASLLVHDAKVKPGDTVQIAVVLDVAKGWHIYWPGQNDSGTPTLVTLTFPKDSGLTAGPVSFPVPKRHALPGDILDYVHEGKVILTIPVKVPATAKVGKDVAITAHVEYLVCHESCMPGEANETTHITIAEKTEPLPLSAKVIDDALAAQPKPQTDGFDAAATAKWEGDGATQALVITAKDAKATRITFYPAHGAAKLTDPIKSGETKGAGKPLRLTFEPDQKPVEGVVEVVSGNTTKSWSFRMARPQPPATGNTPQVPIVKPSSPTTDKTDPATPAR